MLIEKGIKAPRLGSDVLWERGRIEQVAEPKEADQPVRRGRFTEPRERQIGDEMNVARLYRLDLAPHRVAPDRGVKASVDGEDHIGLPGEDLLGRDVDDRARAGILADDIARADEVDDLAADRTGDRRLETARSAGDVDARTLSGRDLCNRFLRPAQYRLGIARERLGPLQYADETADGAQCRGGAREAPAD